MTTTVSVTEETTPSRSDRAEAAARSLPSAALVACALAEAWRERGSIAGPDWLGYAIVAGLVLGAVAASGAALAPSRRLAAGAAALAALAGWNAVSLTWSAVPSLARDEALLTALYAVALLVPALSLRGGLDRIIASAGVVAGLGALAVAAELEVLRAPSVGAVYFDRRLDFPVSYPNGEAAFALLAVWPALALAAQRTLPVFVRALALGAACASAGAWVLAESKGGALGLGASTLVVFAVSRTRLRLAVPFGLAAAVTAVAFVPMTQPYRASGLAAVHGAARAALALAGAGVVLGVVYALVDRRVEPSERTTRRAGRAAAAAVVAAAVAATSVFYARVHDPRDFFAAQWRSFKHLPSKDTASSHFVSLGSNRYDFWRVALHAFAEHPVAGVGSRGFRTVYLQRRHSGETPARAHSVELDALSETGIVGFLLLAAALVLAVAAFARRARDDLVALGALGAFACWLAHASVDWTWSFPAIGVPLFTVLGIASAGGRPRLWPRLGVPLAVLAAAVAVGGFGLPWLAAHYVRTAVSGSPDAASYLARARSLDPLSIEPMLAAWALAPNARAGIPPLLDALRMEPRSPDLLYALGRQQLLAGERVAALRSLRRALRLDPGDPAILMLLQRAHRH